MLAVPCNMYVYMYLACISTVCRYFNLRGELNLWVMGQYSGVHCLRDPNLHNYITEAILKRVQIGLKIAFTKKPEEALVHLCLAQ